MEIHNGTSKNFTQNADLSEVELTIKTVSVKNNSSVSAKSCYKSKLEAKCKQTAAENHFGKISPISILH